MNGLEFWRNVDIRSSQESCWEWKRCRQAKGYGLLRFEPMGELSMQKAHRVAYHLTFGPIQKGKHVLHKCDNPPCCNPYHLYIGTNHDNAQDRKVRGRQQRGKDVYTAKLTKEQVRAIREEYISCQTSCEKLAKRYPVNPSSIWLVLTYQSWPNVAQELRDRIVMRPKVRCGQDAPRAKLTEHQAREAMRRHADGEGVAPLAREFGVAYVSMERLIKGKTWKHLSR